MKAHPLKVERELRGWSQAKVAEAVGTNVRTVIRWEQGKSIPYPYYREQLCALFGKNARELGLLADDGLALSEKVVDDSLHDEEPYTSQDAEVAAHASSAVSVIEQPLSRATPSWNVPPIFSPLVGREKALEDVKELLVSEHVRLVSLTGTGGIGKTRLSIQIAHDLPSLFTDGVCFISLTTSDVDQVMPLVAHSLNLREERSAILDQLQAFLREKHMLLIMDNFEQVVQAAPQLEALLAHCPHLKMLVTTREVLRLASEHQYRLAPLAVPELKAHPDLTAIAHSPAVELFVQRARSVLPQFQVTEANAETLVEICARLDGIPLAIELAAARIRLLPPHALLPRLKQRLQVLTKNVAALPERQQTLRNAIRWSYDLLTEDERFLFRLLSIFADSFTIEFAEVVYTQFVAMTGSGMHSDTLIMDGVDSLIDKSLLHAVVSTDEDGTQEPRLAMLETLQEFGHECLVELGEIDALNAAFATSYVTFSEEAQTYLTGEQQALWLKRLELEHANARVVMAWLRTAMLDTTPVDTLITRQTLALRLGCALGTFWMMQGYLHEGWEFLEQTLRAYVGEVNVSLADAYVLAGQFIMRLGDMERAETLLEQGMNAYAALGNEESVAATMRLLGWTAHQKGQMERAYTLYEQALIRFKALGQQQGMAHTMHNMAFIKETQGDYQQARALLEEVVTRQKALKNTFGTFSALYQLAEVLLEGNEHVPVYRIRAYAQEGLALAEESGNKLGIASMQGLLGRLALREGKTQSARSLIEKCLKFYREGGDQQVAGHYICFLSEVASLEGKFVEARALFEEGMAIARKLTDRTELTAVALEALAAMATAQRNYPWATRLYAAAEQWRDSIGQPSSPAHRAYQEHEMARIREFLGKRAVEVLWQEGRNMLPDEVLLAEYAPVPDLRPLVLALRSTKRPTEYPAGLSVREVEVIQLVAQGLSDAEIATRLALSTRTVTTHLSSIYNKLNIKSRSAAVRFAAEHHLL